MCRSLDRQAGRSSWAGGERGLGVLRVVSQEGWTGREPGSRGERGWSGSHPCSRADLGWVTLCGVSRAASLALPPPCREHPSRDSCRGP